MQIVDSHVHASPVWFEPVETLLFQMDRNNVDKAILIQHGGYFDNQYILDCVTRYPDRFRAVVIVDVSQKDAPDTLETWAKKGASGVRIRPLERSPGSDPLDIWSKAAALKLPVSSLGLVKEFTDPEFEGIIKQFPDLKIVIEHLGGLGLEHIEGRSPETIDEKVFNKILGLADYPNVFIKLPGFGEILSRPFPIKYPTFTAPPPVIRRVYEAFGPQRMMWGSDFPPSASREGYAGALHFPMENVPFFTPNDKEWIFGKTALSVWPF